MALRVSPFVFSLLLIFLLAVPGVGASPSFVYPLMGPRLSNSFGRRIDPIRKHFSRDHLGVDLAAPLSAPVRAISKGYVVFADPYAGYGNLVVIKHSSGFTTHYGHLSKISVKTGGAVEAGAVIGEVGSSGHSTGPHLHFEVRKDGRAIDPESFFPGLAAPGKG